MQEEGSRSWSAGLGLGLGTTFGGLSDFAIEDLRRRNEESERKLYKLRLVNCTSSGVWTSFIEIKYFKIIFLKNIIIKCIYLNG